MSILKRIASVAAAAVMLAEGAVSAYAADGDFLYSKKKNETLMLTKYKGTDTKVTIPAEINGFKVTELYDTFEKNEDITSVIIPSGVKTIGYCAFLECRSLETAVVPEGVETLGLYSFGHCVQLKNITLPKSLKTILPGAFSCCVRLEEINIPKGITEIPSNCFNDCRKMRSVVIPDGVVTIDEGAFSSCAELKTVSVPDSVTTIHDWAFSNPAEGMSIICSKGSTAYNFAKKNSLGVALTGSAERGDVNGDGVINMKDLTTLQRKVNGWDEDVLFKGADADASYEINMKDITTLQIMINSK